MKRATLYNYERDTLEAIERAGELPGIEIAEEAGWSQASCAAAILRLRRFGLIYKAAYCWRLTDLGKIVLAIVRGKETRARLQRMAGRCAS